MEKTEDGRLMTNNVLTLAEKSKDNRLWSPEQMLEAVIRDIQDGTVKPKRAFVILLKENEHEGHEDDVEYTWYRSHIDKRMMVYSMEAVKFSLMGALEEEA